MKFSLQLRLHQGLHLRLELMLEHVAQLLPV